ncbi:urease accessory protein UreD [Labrenzia aggregata]|uniref:Urease accessory protein UreD n=2 Tax=Roseibium aggregatum TaxID=187304 RepID=A0A939EK94_9HYPH|nr:urease accessory protein UreD [Roseibium aggregatum]
MYDAGIASKTIPDTCAMQRVKASARVRFRADDSVTRLDGLFQSGSAKIRLPKVYDTARTAVLINTAGGLTGGDTIAYEVGVGADAHAIVTSQAAERAYRSPGGSAKMTSRLTVEAGAQLEWLPQETILFNESSLTRSLTADLFSDARLLALETVVLGRKAMGEEINSVFFRDSWRIRRDGKLIFADDVRFDGDPARYLSGPATAGQGHVVATFADCALDAEDRLQKARACLSALPRKSIRTAVSAWNGLLVARFVSNDGRDLRNALTTFLTGYRSADLPRVWTC